MRRILLAAVFAALLPVAASAQSRSHAPVATTSASPEMTGTVLVGMEDFSGDTGLALRFDGQMGVKYLAPKVLLSGVVSLGFMHWGDSATYSDGFGGTEKVESGLNIFKVVPAARFTFDVAPQFDLYADAGLGFYYARASLKDTVSMPGFPNQVQEANGSDTGVMMRFAAGGTFNVSPTFKLGAEIGLNPYFGDISDNSFTLMALAQFRM